jgi:hypothetical protein
MASLARADLRATTAVSRFAHLLGFPAKAQAVAAQPAAKRGRAEDDEPKKEDDDSGAKSTTVDDEDREGDASAEAEDEPEEDDDEDEDNKKKSKKAKKAKAATDEEECAEEDDSDAKVASAARAGRAFERARCRAIFAATAAGVRPDVAAQLAFETHMSAKAAIGVLQAAANVQPATAALARTARPRVDLGSGDPPAPSGAKGLAAQIIAAGKKARGEA